MDQRQAAARRPRARRVIALAWLAGALYCSTMLDPLTSASPAPTRQPAVQHDGRARIAVDQAGYLPRFPKHARVVGVDADVPFRVEHADGRPSPVAFAGRLGPARDDVDAGDVVRLADFSPLDAAGRYRVVVDGVGTSEPFAIGPDVFDRPLYLAMRAFYGQRCGTAVDLGPSFPGYRHERCHLEGAYHPSSGRTGAAPSVRGWHDAGDYGRYVATTAFSAGVLALGLELHPEELTGLRLDLPTSGGRTPDILEELRWGLDWMLSMQTADGGVWHKQTGATFSGMVLPGDDRSTSLVVGAGAAPWTTTCASAQFAAASASAARVFRPHDRRYADRLLTAARRAYVWAEAHPAVHFANPADVATGAYADASCDDDRLWAAVELWRATGDADAARVVVAGVPAYLDSLRATAPPGWSDVAALALWSYAMDDRADRAIRTEVRQRAIEAARAVAARIEAHPSRVVLVQDDYVWGSNGVAAMYGVQLLAAARWTRDPALVSAALDVVHYLLGRNPFALSWLTHVGTRTARHLHHRPSAADGQEAPWPGLLAGGPDRRRQDAVLEGLPASAPGRSYVDDEASYASNEFAINWNAALVVLLAGAADAARSDAPGASR